MNDARNVRRPPTTSYATNRNCCAISSADGRASYRRLFPPPEGLIAARSMRAEPSVLSLPPVRRTAPGVTAVRAAGFCGTLWWVSTALSDMTAAVASYARRLHRAAGECHHVASPLGAWLLLALCGPASSGAARAELAELAEVLGLDVEQAAAAASGLLSVPHPLVAAAAGAWRREDVQAEALSRWLASLPAAVETGALPGQAALDDWARRSTLGLIGSSRSASRTRPCSYWPRLWPRRSHGPGRSTWRPRPRSARTAPGSAP
jgi:hypothetical protein